MEGGDGGGSPPPGAPAAVRILAKTLITDGLFCLRCVKMVSLRVKLLGLTFENPLILASGIDDKTPEQWIRAHEEGGAGGVVTKSIGVEPREGYDNPHHRRAPLRPDKRDGPSEPPRLEGLSKDG